MTATLGRLISFAGVPARRVAASAVARGARGRVRHRAHHRSRISDLPRRGAAPDPLADGDDRSRPLLRPRAAARRYIDRIVSHDVALSALGRIRTRFYERIEPLAPGQLAGYRRGELLGRMVGDVDALQGLYVRGLTPLLVAAVIGTACVAATAIVLPAAAAILALGLLLAGVAVPRWRRG